MWTVDMNCCHSCSAKDGCLDRKAILPNQSTLTHELNTDPDHVNGPGDGVIVVVCKEKR